MYFSTTAFILGLLASLHCVGMCGPIALALPYARRQPIDALMGGLAYNLGRVGMYATWGTIIGFFGRGLFLVGLESTFSILLGVLMLTAVVLSLNFEQRINRLPLLVRGRKWVMQTLGHYLQSQGLSAQFVVGMLNGMLPCGLVYVALGGAVATGSVIGSMAYMSLFGFGTLPLMLGTAVAGQFINLEWRRRLRALTPVFLFFFAVLFLFRGFGVHPPDVLRFWEIGQHAPYCAPVK
jgi:sulfite exporter TauE/SafE